MCLQKQTQNKPLIDAITKKPRDLSRHNVNLAM